MTRGSPGPPYLEKGGRFTGVQLQGSATDHEAEFIKPKQNSREGVRKSTSSDSLKARQPSGDPISAQQLATRSPAN